MTNQLMRKYCKEQPPLHAYAGLYKLNVGSIILLIDYLHQACKIMHI